MFNFFRKEPAFKYEMLGVILIILLISYIYFFKGGNSSIFLFSASILGLYLAMNIGANDIANNMGPAVGSKAITLTGALIIAAIFEASGAIIAGGEVVDTIKGGIINSKGLDENIFLSIMLSTLLGAAIWINIATILRAPVSTTHSIIGGLIGAAIAGNGIINWSKIYDIVLSWIISPIMGGIIAVIILISIKNTILKKDDRSEAAKNWLPVFVGIMTFVFSTYLLIKGLKQVIDIEFQTGLFVGLLIGLLIYVLLFLYLKKKSAFFKNSKSFINSLFNIPLIFAVALLSFAHGANDVANAIGPLAAINEIITNTAKDIENIEKVGIPFWITLIGAIGISTGLIMFGARLIKTVGNEITKLNQIRAFSVAISAALTVIIASELGLPISSTHVALGGVFSIGLYREYIKRIKGKDKEYVSKGLIKSIALAWIITLPMSGLVSYLGYFAIMKFN